LDYEKPVSTGVQAKISIGSFLPFSTVSANSCRTHPQQKQRAFRRLTTMKSVTDPPIGA